MLLIPAAGTSRRFADAGYRGHKALHQIAWRGETQPMISWLLSTSGETDVHVGVRYEDVKHFGWMGAQMHVIPDMAARLGQAGSLAYLVDQVRPTEPFNVANCDVFMEAAGWKVLNAFDSAVAVFPEGQADHTRSPYSYALPTPGGLRCAEKRRISRWALAGFYRFPEWGTVLNSYFGAHWNGERYLSGMLGSIKPVCALTEASGFTDFGTPEAVAAAGATLIP